jgi:predicted nuclease of predicted toxin-antitoxin system
MAEVAPRAEDEAVAGLAAHDDRILLTEDKDFGRLVYAEGRPSAGVILIRFPMNARKILPAAVLNSIASHGERISGSFVVVSPGRVRISAAPPAGD